MGFNIQFIFITPLKFNLDKMNTVIIHSETIVQRFASTSPSSSNILKILYQRCVPLSLYPPLEFCLMSGSNRESKIIGYGSFAQPLYSRCKEPNTPVAHKRKCSQNLFKSFCSYMFFN